MASDGPGSVVALVMDRANSSAPPLRQELAGETLGAVPAWVWAIVASCGASFLTVTGFVLQKKGQQDAEDPDSKYPRFGDVVITPKWIVGFALSVIAPLPGDLLAFFLAPLSLTTPLSGFTVVLNMVMAPHLLGERLQFYPDAIATMCILFGTILTTTTGAHADESGITGDTVLHYARREPFLIALGLLLIGLAAILVYTVRHSEGIEERARMRQENPIIGELVLPAVLAASSGSLTNIGLKAVAEISKTKDWLAVGVTCVGGVLPFAMLQLNFVNRGLRLYPQTVFFPVYEALLVVVTTTLGALFYEEEYTALMSSTRRVTCFVAGVLIVVLGICLFMARKDTDEDQLPNGCRTPKTPLSPRTPLLSVGQPWI